MTRLFTTLFLLLGSAAAAFAQNAPEAAAPTSFTEPASAFGVIVFLLLFVGSIGLFFFWVWYRDRESKKNKA